MRALLMLSCAGFVCCVAASVALAAAPKKDLVADAFQLPPGAHLRADQQNDFKRVRERYEPPLKSAVRKLEAAGDEKERTHAAKEVLKLKADIKEQIDTILAKPDPTRPKPQPKKDAPKKNNNKNKNKKKR